MSKQKMSEQIKKMSEQINKMSEQINKNFLEYVMKCRPVWTLTWRECASPSIKSGIPVVLEEDTYFNKEIARNYIDEIGVDKVAVYLANVGKISNPKLRLTYMVKDVSGYSHTVYTPYGQAMSYFMAVINVVIRENI